MERQLHKLRYWGKKRKEINKIKTTVLGLANLRQFREAGGTKARSGTEMGDEAGESGRAHHAGP